MKLRVYLVFLFVVLNTILVSQDLRVISSDKNSILIEYRPTYKDTTIVESNGKKYLKIELPGTSVSNMLSFGEAQKLVRRFNIGVPGEFGNTIQIVSQDYSYLTGRYAPVPVYVKDSLSNHPVYYESIQYGNSKIEDVVTFGEYGQVRELPVQTIEIFPVQFDAAGNNIRLLNRLTVRINFSPASISNRVVISDNSYSSFILNFDAAKNWGISAGSLKKIGSSILADGNWYKIETKEEGIYKIDRTYLQSAGIDVNTLDAKTVKIFGNGGYALTEDLSKSNNTGMAENAIQVFTTADGKFDYLLFYGRGPEFWEYTTAENRNSIVRMKHQFSKSNYYWLTYGGAAGKRMEERTSLSATTFYNQTNTLAFKNYEKDSVNIGKTGREYFGDALTSNTKSRTFVNSLNGIIQGSTISYKIRTVNASTLDIPFRIDETGKQIYQTTIGSNFDYSYGVQDYFIKSLLADLPDERSVLKLSISSDQPNAKVYLDFIEIQYQKYLRALSDNILFFSKDTTANIRYALTNFSSQSIQVFDLTDYANVKSVKGTVDGGIFTFISAEVQKKVKKYLAISNSQYKVPSAAVKVDNLNIRGITSGTEMIIVTSKEFKTPAERYLKYRTIDSPNKLTAAIFYVDDIMNEFGGGLLDPTAIRDFLRHAYQTWTVKPTYVLMFGDGSYDYLNTEKNFNNFVPTYQTTESLNEISSSTTDDFFARIVGNDRKSDLAIGRLNHQTAGEADILIDKIIKYETNTLQGNWRNLITLVADDAFGAPGSFEGDFHTAQSETLANEIIPKSFEQNKIYLAAYPTVFTGAGRRKPDVNKAILNTINDGTLILNYTGHGAPEFWAHEYIFEFAIAKAQLKNDKYFFLTAATCDFGKFDNPDVQSATEGLLLMKDAGIIAGFTASRVVFGSANAVLNDSFYTNIFKSRDENNLPIRLGKAFMFTKQSKTDENDEKFLLFGDPSIRLNMPQIPISIDSINGKSTKLTNQISALSSVKIKGSIKKPDGSINPVNGEVITSFYDSERLVELKEMNYSVTIPGGLIFRGRATVTNGQYQVDFVVPKDISYENKMGKVVTYFAGEKIDGVGVVSNIVVGGTNQNIVNDGKGPEIEIFFDDVNYEGSYLVNPNFTLIAKLKDQTGINTTGLGIGHKLEGILNDDENKTYDLSNFFIGDLNSGGKAGIIKYPFTSMATGDYKIKIKAWDVFNNPSIQEALFTVVSSDQGLVLKEVVNYPNPLSSNTTFTFQHNYNSALNVKIKIYTVAGRLIKQIEEWNLNEKFIRVDWDGRDEDGNQLANGTYLYKINVESADGQFNDNVLGKLSVVR